MNGSPPPSEEGSPQQKGTLLRPGPRVSRRYLARHLGKDAADVTALRSEPRAAGERGDLPEAELGILDASEPRAGGDLLRFDR